MRLLLHKRRRLVLIFLLTALVSISVWRLTRSQETAVVAQGNKIVTPTPTASPTATPPTATPLPTATATPTPSATPLPPEWDAFEPNDTLAEASVITVDQTVADLNLNGVDDVDMFTFFGKAGKIVRLSTFTAPGTDTTITLFSTSGELLADNDDRTATDLGSTVVWVVPSDQWYYLQVTSSIPGIGGEYQLAVLLETPTSTATPTQPPTHIPTAVPNPTATPIPPPVVADDAEPNNDVAHATEIVGGTTYELTLPTDDIDYFRFFVEAGTLYTCDTYPTAVDTTMTLRDQSQEVLAENNNRSAADVGSGIQWTADTTGFVYLTVQGIAGRGAYALVCTGIDPTPRPVSSGGNPQPTAIPATPTPTPITLAVQFAGQLNPSPTPVSLTTIIIRLMYDANGDGIGDTPIENMSVRALQGSRFVGWQLTDTRGEATFTLTGGVDTLLVPLLGYERTVRQGEVNEWPPLVIHAVQLPIVMPVQGG